MFVIRKFFELYPENLFIREYLCLKCNEMKNPDVLYANFALDHLTLEHNAQVVRCNKCGEKVFVRIIKKFQTVESILEIKL